MKLLGSQQITVDQGGAMTQLCYIGLAIGLLALVCLSRENGTLRTVLFCLWVFGSALAWIMANVIVAQHWGIVE